MMQMTMCTATADDSHITDETTISLTSVAAANVRLNSVLCHASSAFVPTKIEDSAKKRSRKNAIPHYHVKLQFCAAAVRI